MRRINVNKIKDAVSQLCVKANVEMRGDIKRAMENALKKERHKATRRALEVLLQNARIAKSEHRALCQDTGVVSVYLHIGQEIYLFGGGQHHQTGGGVHNGQRPLHIFLSPPIPGSPARVEILGISAMARVSHVHAVFKTGIDPVYGVAEFQLVEAKLIGQSRQACDVAQDLFWTGIRSQ